MIKEELLQRLKIAEEDLQKLLARNAISADKIKDLLKNIKPKNDNERLFKAILNSLMGYCIYSDLIGTLKESIKELNIDIENMEIK